MASLIDVPAPKAGPAARAPAHGLSTRASLPVVAIARPTLPDAERRRIARLAKRLLADEPALRATDAFGPRVRAGLWPRGRALAFEDHGSVELFPARAGAPTEYRALLLAGDGDFVAIGERPDPSFEAYCAELLGLGRVDRLVAPASGRVNRLPLRLLRDADAMARLVAAARGDGVFTLIPYVGMGGVWRLAREIAARSGAELRVAAPPPRLTRRVNDKLWFARRVAGLLGRRALPPTRHVYGPAALAAALRTLARRHGQVTVKVPDSAGSRGNITIGAEHILPRTLAQLRSWLIDILGALTWTGRYPLLVGVWDRPTVGSPSVQTWIPHRAEGPPVVEGIFEQVVEGPTSTFVGSRPVDLTGAWHERLAGEAAGLATLLQELGYYGRCSFDAVLAGRSLADAALHWIECNGRWGGVSIPMTLANRLTGDWRRHPFVVVQRETAAFPPRPFAEACRSLGSLLFRPGKAGAGIVLLTPRLVAEGRGLHFMSIADTMPAARALAGEASAILCGSPATS